MYSFWVSVRSRLPEVAAQSVVLCLLPWGNCHGERCCSRQQPPSAPRGLQRLSWRSVLHTHVKMVSHLNSSLFCYSGARPWRGWGLWDRRKLTRPAKFPQGRKIQPSLGIQLWGDDHSCAAAADAELNKSPCRRGWCSPSPLLRTLGNSSHDESSSAVPFPGTWVPLHPRLHLQGGRAHSSPFSPANVAGNL